MTFTIPCPPVVFPGAFRVGERGGSLFQSAHLIGKTHMLGTHICVGKHICRCKRMMLGHGHLCKKTRVWATPPLGGQSCRQSQHSDSTFPTPTGFAGSVRLQERELSKTWWSPVKFEHAHQPYSQNRLCVAQTPRWGRTPRTELSPCGPTLTSPTRPTH